jgi:hypothetical protein
MHGGANEQYLAMHGGGVKMPPGLTPPEACWCGRVRGKVYPATYHDGLGNSTAHHGGVLFICIEYHSVC